MAGQFPRERWGRFPHKVSTALTLEVWYVLREVGEMNRMNMGAVVRRCCELVCSDFDLVAKLERNGRTDSEIAVDVLERLRAQRREQALKHNDAYRQKMRSEYGGGEANLNGGGAE